MTAVVGIALGLALWGGVFVGMRWYERRFDVVDPPATTAGGRDE